MCLLGLQLSSGRIRACLLFWYRGQGIHTVGTGRAVSSCCLQCCWGLNCVASQLGLSFVLLLLLDNALIVFWHDLPRRFQRLMDSFAVIDCPGGASLNEKHAALLGLRAFVLTSPYDVPPWLSDVLMALVKAAGEPAPIKKTVR